MVSFLTDEDFNGRIVRGLFLRNKELDLVRVQDMGLSGADDEAILEWAYNSTRILLTHDARTMPNHVRDRLASGQNIAGVFIVDDLAPIGRCIEEIELIIECSDQSDWQDQLYYLPFK